MPNQSNENNTAERSGSVAGMEDNLKKAVAEMLVLFLLNERDMYIGEIPEELTRRSGGSFQIVFPYSIIYRMVKFEYIDECKKRIAPDGRKRQYYAITDKGKNYLNELRALFKQFSMGVDTILASEGEEYEYSGMEVPETDQTQIDMQHRTKAQNDARSETNDQNFSGRLSGCFG